LIKSETLGRVVVGYVITLIGIRRPFNVLFHAYAAEWPRSGSIRDARY